MIAISLVRAVLLCAAVGVVTGGCCGEWQTRTQSGIVPGSDACSDKGGFLNTYRSPDRGVWVDHYRSPDREAWVDDECNKRPGFLESYRRTDEIKSPDCSCGRPR